ncbi:protein quiver-like [Mya arenaria]|uniref:protein quiver-like n=1 Tax=Mya arenaria TaxID=6604 RepID=UPI0022E90D43|nr:protein quiver-like [Mya arenaria]
MLTFKHLIPIIGVFGCIFLTSSIVAGIDRECYTCNNCNDTTKANFGKTSCTGNCYKMAAKNEKGYEIINRGCLSLGFGTARLHSDTCVTGSSALVSLGDFKGKMCFCNGHKCNTATSVFDTVRIPSIVATCIALRGLLVG